MWVQDSELPYQLPSAQKKTPVMRATPPFGPTDSILSRTAQFELVFVTYIKMLLLHMFPSHY